GVTLVSLWTRLALRTLLTWIALFALLPGGTSRARGPSRTHWTRLTLIPLGTLIAVLTLGTRLALVALRTGRAGVPRFALLTGGSSRTDLTARPRRSGRTLGALRPCRTSRSRGSRQADRTSVAGGSRRSYAVSRVEEPVLGHVLAGRTDPVAVEIPAGGPGRSLTSRWARFTGGSRRSPGTVGPCPSRRARRTRAARHPR